MHVMGNHNRPSTATAGAPATDQQRLYQLKLTLDETTPAVWRRLQVPSSITLAQLHRVFQLAMGWEDYHLHSFSIDGLASGSTSGATGMREQQVQLNQVIRHLP